MVHMLASGWLDIKGAILDCYLPGTIIGLSNVLFEILIPEH